MNRLKKLFYKYFDYEIVGEYYDTKGDGRYHKKYQIRYFLKCLRKKKKRGGHR